MEYNLVKLEELRKVTSANDDDLILLSNNDTGVYQSTHMTVDDAFNSINIRLSGAVRQSFTNLRDTSCIDLNIDESTLKNQADANQAILDIFNTFGTHICELESAVTEPFVIIDSSEPDTTDLEDGWLWADSSGYTSYDLYVLDSGNWVPVSVNEEDVEVNLGYTPAADKGTVTNTAGTDAELPLADIANDTAGLFTGAEKEKLEGIEDGAQVNVIDKVDLGYTPATDKGTVTNTAGADAELPLAVLGGDAGLFTGAEKEKLDKIEEEAQKNVQSDWTETDSTADSFIQNKPNLGSSYTESPTDGKVEITLGTDSTEVTLPARTDDDAGLMLPEDKHELDALSGAINIDAYTGDLDLSIGELNNVNDNADTAIPGNVLVYDGHQWVAKDFEFESGTNFRGTIDLTTDDPSVPGTINPDPPQHGDIYINIGIGQANDKWYPDIQPGMVVTGGEYVIFVDEDGYGGSPGHWEIISVSSSQYVLKTGDTMSGKLLVPVLQVGPDNNNSNLAIIDFKEGNDVFTLQGTNKGIYYAGDKLLSDLEGTHSLTDYKITTNSLSVLATIELVDETRAGLMSPDMYEMLLDVVDDAYDHLEVVDLGYTPSAINGTITNDSGTDAIIPLVDDTNAGLMSPDDRELLYSLIPDAYEDDGYVKITGDVMSGSLDTPELILSDQSVTATPGNVSGILGPLQEPDIDADRDIFDNLTIGTMPGNGTQFYNNKQLPLIINNYFYYLAYKWANPKGAYISDQPLEGLNGPSDMTKLDNALYPHTKELERVKCGVDYENDTVYILFFGEVDANAELRYELYRGVYSTLHETGWKLVKGGSFSSKVITADYSDHHKVFLLRLYDKKVVTVDTKGDLSNTKYSSTKSFYLGNRIQSFGEYSYFLDDTKLVSSNDLFETFEVTEVKNGILLWTPVVHIIYKQRHYFWYDTECKSLDGNLDPDSLLDHPGIGVQANPKDYLTIATDYILYTTVNGEVLYFDGDQTYIDLGQGPTGTTPIDIFAYEPSTGGSYHYFSPGTNDKYDFYINGIPKNALIQPPNSGSGPHLLFNGERVALYKEIEHVDHTLKLELEFDHEFDGFYYRTVVTRNEHSEFAHYEWKWEIDLDGSGTIDATITEAFNTLSDTEKTDLGFVDASSYLLRCTDNSNYPNAKVTYTGTVTFGEIIDDNGDRVPNDLEKPALNVDSGTNQISLWGNP